MKNSVFLPLSREEMKNLQLLGGFVVYPNPSVGLLYVLGLRESFNDPPAVGKEGVEVFLQPAPINRTNQQFSLAGEAVVGVVLVNLEGLLEARLTPLYRASGIALYQADFEEVADGVVD
nr:hypothetical protein [Thermococcus sp. ES12]